MSRSSSGTSSGSSSGSSRSAAVAIVLGCAAILVTMALHPTGSEAIADGGHGTVLIRATLVHALAIGALPFLLGGMAALSWRLRGNALWSGLALASFGLATFAVMIAAAASGFIAPALVGALPLEGAARDVLLSQVHYTGTVNQAFAKIYVGLTGLAFASWCVAMRGSRAFGTMLRSYGVIAGVLPVLGLASGHLHLDVHGFGIVMSLHTTWMAWAAWCLSRNEATATNATAAATPV
jgi:hypothetical protein